MTIKTLVLLSTIVMASIGVALMFRAKFGPRVVKEEVAPVLQIPNATAHTTPGASL